MSIHTYIKIENASIRRKQHEYIYIIICANNFSRRRQLIVIIILGKALIANIINTSAIKKKKKNLTQRAQLQFALISNLHIKRMTVLILIYTTTTRRQPAILLTQQARQLSSAESIAVALAHVGIYCAAVNIFSYLLSVFINLLT